MAGCSKHGDETLGFKICEEFLHVLRNYQLLKKTSAS